jgi:hypothetical protein
VANAISRVPGKVHNISWELYFVVTVGRPNGFEKFSVSARAVKSIIKLNPMASNHCIKIMK